MNRFALRTKFILTISIVFIAATLIVLFVFSGMTGSIINDFALRIATKQALSDKNKILSVIEREVVLAQKMADDSTLRNWALAGDAPLPQITAFEQLESYRRLFRDRSYFIALDSSHRYYVANRTTKPGQPRMVLLKPDNPSDKWYFETIKKVDTFALNLDYNVAIRQIKIWINVVMRDMRGDKIGICGSGIDLTEFLNAIVHSEEKGISTILVDSRGVIQAHEDHALVERNALGRDESKKSTIYSLLRDPAGAEQLKLALESLSAGKQAVAAFPLEINGKHALAAVSFMRDIGWYNIVLVDVSHVLRSGTFLPIILVSVLSLLVVIIVIGYQMNRMVLAPLTLLTAAAHQVAEGSYDITLPVSRNDEIGTLKKSFNAMTTTILNHTADLEENVRLRTVELTLANASLEESQRRITESLQYARVIQDSILPGKARFDRLFAQWFTLYRPSDIVGGDLYWLREFEGRFLLAVIDCTGHGVPGAFMTMTVNSLLNQIVDTICNFDPGLILAEMNRALQETLQLRKSNESLVDAGLDIALCCIDPNQRTVTFAGAGLSLYALAEGKLLEFKGDRQRVGYSGSDLAFVYTNHTLDIEAGIHYYATTDGFLDEGGGEKGYGFGGERFREMLLRHANHPLGKQGELFEQTIAEWRGDRKQRDDITMVGFRF
ncbi:MAG: SpoIIE family protein phosphatase [Desulfuromonadaceae bacterium]|nr:SpoIIE family protein phosphatase [Desulfuromonadaceae bacterium]